MQFSNFDHEAFLRDYWQKKPLLIRNPWDAWTNPLDENDLAGLACEEGVEARLVEQTAEGFAVEHGPFAEDRLTTLGGAPWTLMVQAVDHYVPEVAALIEPFRFIPNWRIDDVMVSVANDDGGVGAHFDNYDVFLIQGAGARRWEIGGHCDENIPLLPHDDLRLLAEFEPTGSWLLEPGDILYVPPGIAHNGVTVGMGSMTYSVGFRAPSRKELIGHFADEMAARLGDDDRYSDPDLRAQSNPGEITEEALDQLHSMVTETLGDREAFARWFGSYGTEPKYDDARIEEADPIDAETLRERLTEGATLHRNPASRFSFVRQSEEKVLLFVDGECFKCEGKAAEFAERVCAQVGYDFIGKLTTSRSTMNLIAKLLNLGGLSVANH